VAREIGYARVSTTKQDLDRQIGAPRKEGIAAGRIYVDKKSGASTNHPGLRSALAVANAAPSTEFSLGMEVRSGSRHAAACPERS
jgi:DNA invertase Pin-like site-specific DNA recombinase